MIPQLYIPSGRATFTYIKNIILYIPHYAYRGCVRHTKHRTDDDAGSAVRHAELNNIIYIMSCVQLFIVRKRREIRFGSHSRTHTHTHTLFSSSVVKFKNLPLGPSLDQNTRIFVTTVEINPRDCFLILLARNLHPTLSPRRPRRVCDDIGRIVGRFKNPRCPRAVVHPFSKYAEIDVIILCTYYNTTCSRINIILYMILCVRSLNIIYLRITKRTAVFLTAEICSRVIGLDIKNI